MSAIEGYTKTHEWIMVEGDVATMGITDYAQEQLSDVVFVELPDVGDEAVRGEEVAVVESTKVAESIYSPVNGGVVEINPRLDDEPALINQSPMEDGWLIKIKVSNMDELEVVVRRAVNLACYEKLAPEDLFIGLTPTIGKFTFNLLQFDNVKKLFKSSWYPTSVQLVSGAFFLYIFYLGFWGMQHPASNVSLGDHLTQRIEDIAKTADKRDEAQRQVTKLTDELSSTANKLAIAGLSQTLGQLLIEQRRALPDLRGLKKQTRDRERLVATVGLQQIEFSEQRRDLRNTNSTIEKVAGELSPEELAEFGPELNALGENQSELLDKLINAGARYLSVLGELDLAQRQLTDTVTDYKAFLARTLLWVRTTAPIDIQALIRLPDHAGR